MCKNLLQTQKTDNKNCNLWLLQSITSLLFYLIKRSFISLIKRPCTSSPAIIKSILHIAYNLTSFFEKKNLN